MALPYSISTSYVPNNPPAWKAQDFNDLQKYLSQAYNLLGLPSALPTTGSDVPQMILQNAASNNRVVLVDHNGLPTMGGVTVFREDWRVPISAFTTAGAMTSSGMPQWFLTVAGTPTGLVTNSPPGQCGFVNLNTNANKLALATNNTILIPGNTFQSTVLETDFTMDAIGGNSMTVWFGFSGGRDPSSPSNGYAWFKKATGDTNWQVQTNDGTTTNSQDSGQVPIIDASYGQKLRVEYHGSAAPYGNARVRFFVGSTLVATSTANLPTQNQYIVAAVLCTSGSGTGHDINIGPVVATANRFPSTAAL